MLIRRGLGLRFLMVVLLTVAVRNPIWSEDEVNPQIVAHLNAGEFPAARVLAQQMVPDMRDLALARIAQAQWGAGARNGWANTVNGMNNVQTGGSGLAGPMFAGQAPGFAGQSNGFGDPANLGGASQANFTELMDLIKKTTGNPKPGWLDDGGVGTVEPFRGGVYVDAGGLLHKLVSVDSNPAFAQRVSLPERGNRRLTARNDLHGEKMSVNDLPVAEVVGRVESSRPAVWRLAQLPNRSSVASLDLPSISRTSRAIRSARGVY